MKKRFDRRLLITAALISSLLFVAGVGVGASINDQKSSLLRERIMDLNGDLQAFQLEFLMLETLGEEATCPLLRERLNQVNEQSYELGQRLVSYEDVSRFTNADDIADLKKSYYRSLIRYWLLGQQVEDICNESTTTVIFFFEPSCPACDDQAVVLDYYKILLGEEILIFAINTGVDDPFIRALVDHFKVSQYPTLIVDGTIRPGFTGRDDLHKELCNRRPGLQIC